uniref:TlpA disulfide reductase family protein n=1 Tax=uncultured Winogradskyella sp. TaxID=395353 RepID=UPI00260C894D
MKQIFLFGLLLIISCKSEVQEVVTLQSELENTQQDVASISEAITLEVYDYNGLKPLINKKDDKVHVVNFWATWCAPCVKELPYFEAIKEDYKDDNVEVLLVSLDFPRNYDSKLK